jgi:hypothetical protein
MWVNGILELNVTAANVGSGTDFPLGAGIGFYSYSQKDTTYSILSAKPVYFGFVGENLVATRMYEDDNDGSPYAATIDWGDGSAVETVTVNAGLKKVTGNHVFGAVDTYDGVITITDKDGASDVLPVLFIIEEKTHTVDCVCDQYEAAQTCEQTTASTSGNCVCISFSNTQIACDPPAYIGQEPCEE